MDKIRAFLDTSVLISYFDGNSNIEKIFSQKIMEKCTYVVNHIVIQELIFAMARSKRDVDFEEVYKFIQIDDIDFYYSFELASKVEKLRNLAVHANDVLLIGTAVKCKYFVTSDMSLLRIGNIESTEIVTPSKFLEIVGGEK